MKEQYVLVDYTDTPYSKVTLSKELIKRLASKIHYKVGTTKKTPIGKRLGIEPKAWNNFVTGKEIIVNTLEVIRKYCNERKGIVRKGILSIDHIDSPNTPLNFDCVEGARLDAAIYNEGRVRNRSVEYHNKDDEVIGTILECAKKVIGKSFKPKIGIDKRNNVKCIYFPPYFAKHYVKLGIAEKRKSQLKTGIPKYILNGPTEYKKAWTRGTLSEDGSLFIRTSKIKGMIYFNARIQINRVSEVDLDIQLNKGIIYQKDVPPKILKVLKDNINQIISDEARILNEFGMKPYVNFSKLKKAKNGRITATYSLIVYRKKDVKRWREVIGAELPRHQKQLELVVKSRGGLSKREADELLYAFYSLTPVYLRGPLNIKRNKWLSQKSKRRLLEGVQNAQNPQKRL